MNIAYSNRKCDVQGHFALRGLHFVHRVDPKLVPRETRIHMDEMDGKGRRIDVESFNSRADGVAIERIPRRDRMLSPLS